MVVTSAYLSYHSLRISLNQSGQEFLLKLLRLLCVQINSFWNTQTNQNGQNHCDHMLNVNINIIFWHVTQDLGRCEENYIEIRRTCHEPKLGTLCHWTKLWYKRQFKCSALHSFCLSDNNEMIYACYLAMSFHKIVDNLCMHTHAQAQLQPCGVKLHSCSSPQSRENKPVNVIYLFCIKGVFYRMFRTRMLIIS